MALEQIFFLSQILAAIAVVASLLFVGFELRHGTRATRAQIHQNITLGWLSVGPMIAENSRIFAAGIAADETAFKAMPNEEKLAFLAIAFAFFKHYENMYEQQKEGFIRARFSPVPGNVPAAAADDHGGDLRESRPGARRRRRAPLTGNGWHPTLTAGRRRYHMSLSLAPTSMASARASLIFTSAVLDPWKADCSQHLSTFSVTKRLRAP